MKGIILYLQPRLGRGNYMAVTSFAYMTQDSLKSIDIITNGLLIWAEGEGLTLNYTEEHEVDCICRTPWI